MRLSFVGVFVVCFWCGGWLAGFAATGVIAFLVLGLDVVAGPDNRCLSPYN